MWISALTYLSLICPIYACALFLPSVSQILVSLSLSVCNLLTALYFAQQFYYTRVRGCGQNISSSACGRRTLMSYVNSFGYSQTISQLLTVPPYAVATIVLITSAYYSDKLKLRSPFIFAGQCLAVVGYIINITNAPRGVKYFGMFLCTTGAYSGFPGVIAWLGNNLAPTYKRGRFQIFLIVASFKYLTPHSL